MKMGLWMVRVGMVISILVCVYLVTAEATIPEVVSKLLHQNVTLPCECHGNQTCHYVINNNLTNTGSYINRDGNLFVPGGTWGKACCGPDMERLQCWIICAENERCETCHLTLSTNASSVNDMIRATEGGKISFNVTFPYQYHNGFSFQINGDFVQPNFPCTVVRDTDNILETLLVQYHCTAMSLGNYTIIAYVSFCNFDYYSETEFTVIVENESDQPPTPSISQPAPSTTPTDDHPAPSSTSSPQLVSSSSPVVTPNSTSIPTSTTISSSVGVPTKGTSTSPTTTSVIEINDRDSDKDTTGNDDTTTATIVVAVICGFILVAVIGIIVILLLYKFYPRATVPAHSCQQQRQTSVTGDLPTQYEVHTSISNITSEGSEVLEDPRQDTSMNSSLCTLPLGGPETQPSEPVSQEPIQDTRPHQSLSTFVGITSQ